MVKSIEPNKLYRVKTWEETEKEFGLSQFNNINCKCFFTPPMEYNVSTRLINRQLKFPSRNIKDTLTADWRGWNFHAEMLEDITLTILKKINDRVSNEKNC